MSNLEIPWLADAIARPLLDIYAEGTSVSVTETPTRILIADGRARVRFGLRTLLEKQSDVEVAGEVDEANQLVDEVKACCADLVLVDWGLPGLEHAASLQALREECPEISLIVLSGQPEVRRAALQAGADAFVNKTESPVHLLSVIKSCCRRDTYQIDERNA